MEFDNTLDVPLPPDEAWTVLLDIRRIAGCIPGAELTQVVDDRSYKGKVAVRLGPVALTLVGHASFEAIDHAAHTARVRARGADPKGRGGSDSVIDFRLEPADEGTRVLIHTNVTLSGSIAQYGRGAGMIQAFAQQLIVQFGENLKARLTQTSPLPDSGESPGAGERARGRDRVRGKPISGLSVMTKALMSSIKRDKGDP